MKEHTRRMGQAKKSITRIERLLFSSDLPLTMEREMILETLLTQSQSRVTHLASTDISKASVAARLLLDHSIEMGLEVDLISRLAMKDGTLILVRPLELKARALLLASALGFGGDVARVVELAICNPSLLSRSSSSLARSLPNMSALFKSRGLSLTEMSRAQPDLLLQAPGTLRNKMDAIPAALDLPPRVARDLIATCPQLLRRSPSTLHERFKLLQRMFDSVPRNFLSELVLQEPKILCYSSATMRDKFASLLSRYGSFQDDVVDMILVDPNVLLKVMPRQDRPTRPAEEGKGKKNLMAIGKREDEPKPAGEPLSGVERLLGLSREIDASLVQVIDLVLRSSPEVMEDLALGGDVAARIAALATALAEFLPPGPPGIRIEEAREVIKAEPRLIFIPLSIFCERVEHLKSISPSLLTSSPKLLTRETSEIKAATDNIREAFGNNAVQNLLSVCPDLLLTEQRLTARLTGIEKALGVSVGVVKELIVKEPRLLTVPLEEIERAFASLCASFGSFRDDALEIILVDPSSLLSSGNEKRRTDEKTDWEGSGAVTAEPKESKKRIQRSQKQKVFEGGQRT